MAGFLFGDQETDFLVIAVVDRSRLGSGFAGYLHAGRDERQVGGQHLVGKHLSPAAVAADLAERQPGVAHPGGVRHADGIVDFVAAPFFRGHDAAVAVIAGDAGRWVDRQGAGIVTGTAATAHYDSWKRQQMPIGFEAGFEDQAARRGDADIFEHDMQRERDTVVVAHRSAAHRKADTGLLRFRRNGREQPSGACYIYNV